MPKTNAQRQKEFRERRHLRAVTAQELLDALILAIDRGRSSKLVDGLPNDPQAAIEEVIRRLDTVALVKFPPRDPLPRDRIPYSKHKRELLSVVE